MQKKVSRKTFIEQTLKGLALVRKALEGREFMPFRHIAFDFAYESSVGGGVNLFVFSKGGSQGFRNGVKTTIPKSQIDGPNKGALALASAFEDETPRAYDDTSIPDEHSIDTFFMTFGGKLMQEVAQHIDIAGIKNPLGEGGELIFEFATIISETTGAELTFKILGKEGGVSLTEKDTTSQIITVVFSSKV
jgi:hypothetical protein